jgi:hypothetical protein
VVASAAVEDADLGIGQNAGGRCGGDWDRDGDATRSADMTRFVCGAARRRAGFSASYRI